MRIASAWSTDSDTEQAVGRAIDCLKEKLGSKPDFLIAYYTDNHCADTLASCLNAWAPKAAIQGCSSCLGSMTEEGYHSHQDTALALWAISDSRGGYGTALVELDDPKTNAIEALNQALIDAGRPGEQPDLIWLYSAPGSEEEILSALQSVVGPKVTIAGGSAADASISGNWSLIGNQLTANNAISLSVLFPKSDIAYSFHSGYLPTENHGVATKTDGRILYEVDGEAAVDVYNRWTGDILKSKQTGERVLAETTLYPLGREVGRDTNLSYYQLSHPESITADGGLQLFTNIESGDTIYLMTGSKESLVHRSGRVAESALNAANTDPSEVIGALSIYCAGCMLKVREQMPTVVEEMNHALQTTPLIGAFTFGEQGCHIGGENTHGNLMISNIIFFDPE